MPFLNATIKSHKPLSKKNKIHPHLKKEISSLEQTSNSLNGLSKLPTTVSSLLIFPEL
jgi:hypothetical protein